ncbi:MAG: RluA family pseudouridine synthase [Prevotella sp.]|nr:RluA family pseudouridine synthase [Prevotella sp.]
MTNDVFHPMKVEGELPAQLNNPFDYEPHPLCVEAARRVCEYLSQSPLHDEVMQGKMLGVLVCQQADGTVGFLAAYSGQLGGREDWPWFVPAVFDYLQPDGYFKQEEAHISAINQRIAQLESASDYVSARATLAQLKKQAEDEIVSYKTMMQAAKTQRDAIRNENETLRYENENGNDALIRESQFQKAELRRLKKRWEERLTVAAKDVERTDDSIATLKKERKERSDALQRWLFDQFIMLNAQGERRTLTDIFANTPQHIPPSGSGECCAPKLLQYAFAHRLKPLCMAEFWQGASPKMEVRHHGQYYPACRGKCKPILEWMLSLQPTNDDIEAHEPNEIRIVYEDDALLVIDKPAGLLSVPGKTDEESVQSLLQKRYGEVFMVHRLDQDTSGLMVVAKSREAHRLLQQQFLSHTRVIYKMYVALLDGVVEGRGTISLPLRPDVDDRPRQMVDHEHGKEAVTDYEVLGHEGSLTRIALMPHTGRTHQLRMHCAYREGLGVPIVGDRLYGHRIEKGQHLCLHAAELAFQHPLTGERMRFSSVVPF